MSSYKVFPVGALSKSTTSDLCCDHNGKMQHPSTTLRKYDCDCHAALVVTLMKQGVLPAKQSFSALQGQTRQAVAVAVAAVCCCPPPRPALRMVVPQIHTNLVVTSSCPPWQILLRGRRPPWHRICAHCGDIPCTVSLWLEHPFTQVLHDHCDMLLAILCKINSHSSETVRRAVN